VEENVRTELARKRPWYEEARVREETPFGFGQRVERICVRQCRVVRHNENVDVRDAGVPNTPDLVDGIDVLVADESVDDLLQRVVVQLVIAGTRKVDQFEARLRRQALRR
jgi:hypothetical protein